MKITNSKTLKQSLANIQLEALSLSPEVEELFQRALIDSSIDTEDIKQLLLKPYLNKS